jgi:hypothetical protein
MSIAMQSIAMKALASKISMILSALVVASTASSQSTPVSGKSVDARVVDTLSRLAVNEDYLKVDLFQRHVGESWLLSPAETAAVNERALRALEGDFAPQAAQKRRSAMDPEVALKLQNSIAIHPVVGDKATAEYDNRGFGMGFCFGRAAYVHMMALRLGLGKGSIKKIFAVGDQRTGDVHWRYHVATAVFTKNGWMVLDNVPGKMMTPREWLNWVNESSTDGKLRIYVTEPEKFAPGPGRYTPAEFGLKLSKERDAYAHYFRDLVGWFALAGEDSFRRLGLPVPKLRTTPTRACSQLFKISL